MGNCVRVNGLKRVGDCLTVRLGVNKRATHVAMSEKISEVENRNAPTTPKL